MSLCPGTKNGSLSRNNSLCPGMSFSCFRTSFPVLEVLFCFRMSFYCFRTSFFCFRMSFSALSRFVPRDGTGQAVKISSRSMSHPGVWQTLPTRPVPLQDFELVPLSLCPGTKKKLLSLCPKKLLCPVPLETLPGSESDSCQTTKFPGSMLWYFVRHFCLVISEELYGSYFWSKLE